VFPSENAFPPESSVSNRDATISSNIWQFSLYRILDYFTQVPYTELAEFEEGHMKIAVFGTGMVGKTIADKVHSLEEPVTMGTRNVEKTMAADEGDHDGNPPFSAWIAEREGIRLATYLDAAAVADMVFLALPGEVVLEVLRQIGPAALAGMIIIDLTNPLDFSNGMPPTLSIVNDDSLGERVQAALPESRVVKTLNIVTASLMVNPGALADGDHSMFMSGNDTGAKAEVEKVLRGWFGWEDIIDLGDIGQARGMEMYLPLWLRLWGAVGNANFNIKIVR
jgi:predicted dinucleotide-binding enzyme